MTKKNKPKNASTDFDKQHIKIKGARSNNLKNIDVSIPKKKLVVVTGLSGSGKSSLIMDTLYAEGQRRYVESLSSYARQFLNRMKKPEVDYIKGICPAIAIEQRVTSSNARSTVGSMTEIYDYLRLLYARIGKTFSPISGDLVKKHSVTDVVEFLMELKKGTKVQVFTPISKKYADRKLKVELELLLQKGYSRIRVKKEITEIQDFLESKSKLLQKDLEKTKDEILILIDRFAISRDEENQKRIADSIQTAFYESEGDCILDISSQKEISFNNRFQIDGKLFVEATQQLFNFNNSFGACKQCEGYGRVMGIDPLKVVPNSSLSVFEGAIACWKGEKFGRWLDVFISESGPFGFPIHRPYNELSDEEKDFIWSGKEIEYNVDNFFEQIESQTYKIQNRVLLARYRGRTTCPRCKGGRLREDAYFVKIDNTDISQLTKLPIDELSLFFENIKLDEYDYGLAKRIILEITNRLETMCDIGLGYLQLDRLSNTLSGGETQRIHLTRTLGSNLTNSMYILDEPSIGLHPKDTEKLVAVLKRLRNLGNTVIVVEHEEEMISNADYIIDIGPNAGRFGGELVYAGEYKKFMKKGTKSLTAAYLKKEKVIPVPDKRRKVANKILIKKAAQHNLKDLTVSFPLHSLTVVTGVSGSGKTSLVKHILYPAIKRRLGEPLAGKIGAHKMLDGDLNMITGVEMINQNPIGKSSRSNPVTYVKAYDAMRKLMCNQQLSKIRGFKPKHFSFNVDGGRCETCKGEGEITIEMQFLADIKLTCDECQGKRFRQEVLDVKFDGKNIADMLDMSIEEALEFFADQKEIYNKIKPLDEVGLGYVKLGQSSATLSGGEAQRIKLASYLSKRSNSGHILFIFDEPTTGLHFHDIAKLLYALNALVENGHTVVVVEHNVEVIKCADWVIDLGPDGGKAGGNLVFEGTPEKLVKVKNSHTGRYLKEKL